MNNSEKETQMSLQALEKSVNELISFYKNNYDFNKPVYALWNGKDILGHLVFWHESFARNVKDLAHNIKPTPLKGKLSEVNELSVQTTKEVSVPNLLLRMYKAQEVISANILYANIELIPYKKGSRDYSRLEHLQVVSAHINKHLKDLVKAFK